MYYELPLMNEFSQSGQKCVWSLATTDDVASGLGSQCFFNVGMNDDQRSPSLPIFIGHYCRPGCLNSKRGRFCGGGLRHRARCLECRLMRYPGVSLRLLLIDPADAYLFAQINNGNALSLPFANRFGLGRRN